MKIQSGGAPVVSKRSCLIIGPPKPRAERFPASLLVNDRICGSRVMFSRFWSKGHIASRFWLLHTVRLYKSLINHVSKKPRFLFNLQFRHFICFQKIYQAEVLFTSSTCSIYLELFAFRSDYYLAGHASFYRSNSCNRQSHRRSAMYRDSSVEGPPSPNTRKRNVSYVLTVLYIMTDNTDQ